MPFLELTASTSPSRDSASDPRLHVAILGGGITGITLALGLLRRGVKFTIYERASAFKEIGAGIGFSPNAEEALKALDPRVHEAYQNLCTPNGEDYFQWVNGLNDELMFKLYLGEQAFRGCRRCEFIDELAKLVPEGRVKFSKEIDMLVDSEEGPVQLKFKDGTVESADIVIGCDGIRSRVRQLLLGEDNPASYATYSQKFCFRGLVPMAEARKHMPAYRTTTRFMYNGPDAHSITYPVAMGEYLNVLLVVSDPEPWRAEGGKHTARGSKDAAVDAFAGWHATARALVDLLPAELDKWAIFDMLEHPAPAYARGRIAVAGDAAHASGPHLGAGAGFGIEDALALAALLQALDRAWATTTATTPSRPTDGDAPFKAGAARARAELAQAALAAYNAVRYDRAQELPGLTREAVDLFQWNDPQVGSDAAKFGSEITWRFHKIWKYDVDGMVRDALADFAARTQ